MRTYNIHEAKTHLSRLIDEVENGESFIIAKAGKPKAQVIPIRAPQDAAKRRIGFLKGKIKVPDNFDTMMADEIEKMFYGNGRKFSGKR
jgi:prevent-host-death family protein